MKNKNRLILVDGSGYIFRAFYALPPMNRPDGTPINAVYGFTNMIIKLIEDYQNDKMIVIFDAARENFRNKIYKEYKANRGETPEDLKPQFEIIKKCVDAFNLPQLEIEGFEADDIIATYTELAKKQKIYSLIISSDKDLMQLVDSQVEMLDPIKNKKIGIKEVEEKFGVSPDKVIQIQALTGDKVDNIPGAPGVGPKTAAEMINNFDDIEGLIKNYKKIKQEKKQIIIKENQENIRLSLKLVSLKKDIKLPLDIEKLNSYNSIQNKENSIKQFLIEQGFKSLLSRLEKNNYIFIDYEKKDKNIKNKANFISVQDTDKLIEITQEINKVGFCSIDIETDSLNIDKANLVGVSLCFNSKDSFYIPINHKNIDTNKILSKQIDLKVVLKYLSIICSDEAILKIGQNIKYDIRVLTKYGIKFNSIADTMLLSYALDNGITRHNMDDLAFKHLSYNTKKFKDIVGSGKKQITFDYVNIREATDYAAEDAFITLKLYEILNKRLVKEKTNFVYNKIDKPLIEVLTLMENNGIKIDKKYLNHLSIEFSKQIENLEKKIFKITKEEFNIGSPKQLGEILFEKLKITGSKKTKTGTYSTDSSILENLSFNGVKVAKYVLEWRELSKLKSTYADALVDQISSITQRVHTSYASASTITGRLSSNDPNLQNIPIRTNNGKKIRNAFIAEKNYKLVSCDYSQIELRLAAEISNDKNLINAFKNNEDIHSSTASKIFGIEEKNVKEEDRRKAKAINFGIIYGISPYGLAKQLDITNSEGKQYIDSYFKRFPNIKEYMNEQIKFCKKNNYVQTMFGRKCFIVGINDKNFSVRGFSERQSINAPIQGTAADIIKLAMINIHKEIQEKKLKAKMLLQVHDELVFEIRDNEIKESIKQIKKIMEKSHEEYKTFRVPLVVDFKIGDNWGESN